jgi:hypothetical protein
MSGSSWHPGAGGKRCSLGGQSVEKGREGVLGHWVSVRFRTRIRWVEGGDNILVLLTVLHVSEESEEQAEAQEAAPYTGVRPGIVRPAPLKSKNQAD